MIRKKKNKDEKKSTFLKQQNLIEIFKRHYQKVLKSTAV